ncbi:MAG: DNA topoisomerase VI subunit B [Candidatus Hermodarchaeota archaeon]|nr:DNA topoisomerase VI subunit B [Candidatus Hermodarchaeota archaeon]
MATTAVSFESISPADFFYRNRSIAGFDNNMRALYTAVRELVENSLDACEDGGFLPTIKVKLSEVSPNWFRLRVEDNGIGVPRDHILPAFGQILYGSKYEHKQARGRFGLGGKMAFLFGQITTSEPLQVVSAPSDGEHIFDVVLRQDIEENKPELVKWERRKNREKKHGCTLEFTLEGNWRSAKRYIIDYIEQTALITPYASLTFTEPDGTAHKFKRSVKVLPPQPTPVNPHPKGMDIEQLSRIIEDTKTRDMVTFLRTHFHRVGPKTAKAFLKSINMAYSQDPRGLKPNDLVKIARGLEDFDKWLPPDARVLSPLGTKLLELGIRSTLNPEFVKVTQRPPNSYGGHPFIVECGLAYGGDVPMKESIIIYRFANRIPLIFDEYKDVAAKVIRAVPWSRYRIRPGMPIAAFVAVVSTKIPFKTAGKEFIADLTELEYDIRMGLMECARSLKGHLRQKEKVQRERVRASVYEKYLPIIARDIAALAGRRKVPDTKTLIQSALSIKLEDEEEEVLPPPAEEGILEANPPEISDSEDSDEEETEEE